MLWWTEHVAEQVFCKFVMAIIVKFVNETVKRQFRKSRFHINFCESIKHSYACIAARFETKLDARISAQFKSS